MRPVGTPLPQPPISLVRTLIAVDRRPRETRLERAGWPTAGVLAAVVALLGVYVWTTHTTTRAEIAQAVEAKAAAR
jgi:hypothetical protein